PTPAGPPEFDSRGQVWEAVADPGLAAARPDAWTGGRLRQTGAGGVKATSGGAGDKTWRVTWCWPRRASWRRGWPGGRAAGPGAARRAPPAVYGPVSRSPRGGAPPWPQPWHRHRGCRHPSRSMVRDHATFGAQGVARPATPVEYFSDPTHPGW